MLSDSLPNPASQLTEQRINTMDPDKMRRMLLRFAAVGRASQAVTDNYGSETESEVDSTLRHPAASEQAQDERSD